MQWATETIHGGGGGSGRKKVEVPATEMESVAAVLNASPLGDKTTNAVTLERGGGVTGARWTCRLVNSG